MREVTEEYKEIISRLQKVLLENTSDLSDELRSKIYSRFNNVRYFLVDCDDSMFLKKSVNFVSNKCMTVFKEYLRIQSSGEAIFRKSFFCRYSAHMHHPPTENA